MIAGGLWLRRWLSLAVLVVSAVTVAAAAVGPVYLGTARTAVVRDALEDAPPDHRGWRITSVVEDAADLARQVSAPFLTAPILGAEMLSPDLKATRTYPLMWQDGQCEHVVLVKGRCPAAAAEIMVTRASGFKIGAKVKLGALVSGEGADQRPMPLRVVGIYHADAADPFWFGRNLFTQSAGTTDGNGDPLFTVPQTRQIATTAAGVDWVDPADGRAWNTFAIVYVDPLRITSQDLPALESAQARLAEMGQSRQRTIVFTYMRDTLAAIRLQLDSLSVPTTLVTLQLVALGWLLLFLTVRDLVVARAPEIALARLRGLSTARVWAFGLSEPAAILLAAVPLGLAAAWTSAGAMAHGLLRAAGLPVVVDVSAVLYGLAAALGGLLAAAGAARRTVTQPVVEQWRRTPRARSRTWIPEAVVLAVTVVGIGELLSGGVITESGGRQAAALLAPGLLAVAFALPARRLLPLACAALFRLTRRRGGIGAFLAIRQVARGAATGSTVIVLGAGLALAVFAVAAWSVTARNFGEVARVHNGAETVYVVPRGDAAWLRGVSAGIPGAAPVIRVPGRPLMLATDPARFAEVALWRPAYASGRSLSALTPKATPAGLPPRVLMTGDRIRVRLKVPTIPKGWSVILYTDFRVPRETGPRAVPVARPVHGQSVYEWGLPRGCQSAACELRGVRVTVTPGADADFENPPGALTITGFEVQRGGRWEKAEAGLGDAAAWRPPVSGHGGLTLSMSPFGGASSAIPATFPDPLPVLSNGRANAQKLPGLDAGYLAGYSPAASAVALPGLDDVGAVVDLELADRVTYGYSAQAEFQIWAAPGRGPAVREALRKAGVPVLATRTVDELEAGYAGQGPGLALVLLIMSAGAAALLALGRAVLSLYAEARRRTYELTALEAAGAQVGPLRRALLLEQVITLCWASLAGIVAGVSAAMVALPRVPEFADPPVTPPLVYTLIPAPIILVAAAALVASLLAAALTSELLLRGVRYERLREAPA
ncbi:hypothetical protein J5X84_19825 [Streptosporangiaceae bacterium NEAU-GS5]|nr:hypothetical protein [Streptosporangiaceae bacterium NEAU-GS5]